MDQMGFQVPGMASAPMNPPPPFFGGYGPDGGMSQLPPEIAAQMFPDSMLYEDPHEAKRRRIARACDMCRKKKIKCDGKLPACTQCINYKTDCVFTQVEKKRTPPKGAKYIEGLENRLERMEHLLRLSGLLDEEETDLGALEKRLQDKQRSASVQASQATASTPGSPSQRTATINATSPHSTNTVASPDTNRDNKTNIKKEESVRDEDEEAEVENLSDMMCSLVTNQSGETRYIGSSSGFSIFSPKGIQWVNSKTGDNSFQHMITEVSIDDHKWTNWKPEVFNDVFRRPVFRPLPPKPEALSLLQDYFENFNCMFPLFHQPTFMHLVERQYSPNPYQGSGWWASLNCALAIAHRLRVMSNLVPAEEDEKAWDYLKNALGVFAELTMRNTDLLSVQGLLGMALFMQGTPNPQPAFLLIASAMRLAHSIGLHKKGTGFNLNPIEIEQRKRVFWIAYILDKDICLRSGRPPAQDDDDMNVELPDADPEDNIGNIPLADGKGKMNLFRIMCEFSVIESNVYRRLYSTKASKQSNGELLNAIGELDGELEEWKDRIPIDFRPEHEIRASHTPLILHIVMLHLTYYNCLTTIHRMSVHHGFWTSRLSNYAFQGLNTRALNPRVYSSAALCTAAARASISMLKYIPQGDFSCVWMILYFPVSSLMILFGNILQNPLDPRAKSDTRLMNTVVTFLSMLGQEAEQGGVHRMLGVCAEFERIGRLVIEKAEKEQSSKRKRKTQDTSGASKPESAAASTGNPAMSGNTPAAHSKSPNMPNMPATPANSGVATQPSHAPTTTTPTTSTGAYLVPENAQEGFNLGTSPYSPFGGSSPGMMPNVSPWGQADFNQQQAMQPQNGDYETYTGFPPQDGRPVQFQQPLLPQGLFSLPATLDWNWAELSGGAYPTVENGNFGDFGGDDSNK